MPLPDGIILRARNDGDYPALAEMLSMPDVLPGTLRLPYQNEAFYRDFMKDAPHLHPIVADCEGRLVGQGVLTRHSGRRAHVGEIAVAVRADFSRRGIGGALMTALCDLADNWLGLRRLTLEVYADNFAAIRLYERHGFVREGLLRAESLRNGELVDSVAMGRLVAPPPHRETPDA